MLTWDDVVGIARALPGVEVTTSYGSPSLKVNRKLFARLRAEPEGGMMLRCTLEEKELLLNSGDPACFTTPHYDGYPAILIRLEKIDRSRLAEMIEEAWFLQAPAKLRKLHTATTREGSGESGGD